jgi:hypothetical protein
MLCYVMLRYVTLRYVGQSARLDQICIYVPCSKLSYFTS